MLTNQKQLNFVLPQIKGERTEPRFWVKEFAFFTDFTPETEVRRISLRRGLNIIWAKESETGASGHAAGKSSCCRLLRYLIGDTSFGSETFRYALRSKIPKACIAGEVILNGEPWLVCRSLSESGGHWSAQGHGYDDLFKGDFKKEPYDNFIQALQKSFITPLTVETYPGTNKKLEWQHLLQWLSRDQDARYSETLNWRVSGEPNHLQSSEKTNLIRLVLGLLKSDELKQQRTHSELLKERNEIKTLLPKLQFARDRELKKLKSTETELRDENYDLETKLEELQLLRGRQAETLENTIEDANETDGVDECLKTSGELKHKTCDTLQGHLDALRLNIKRTTAQRNYRMGKLSKEELNQQLSQLGDIEGKCSELIEDAIKANCPLAPSLNRDELTEQRLEIAKQTVAEIEARISNLEERKVRLKTELKNAQTALDPVEKKISENKEAHNKAKKQLREDLQKLNDCVQSLEQALNDTVEMRTKRERQSELDDEIRNSNEALSILRKQASKLQSTVTDNFSYVATHLTQRKTDASIEFRSDAVLSSLDYDGDLSSAALVTLRLLIFDLACLLGSISKTNHHPGFLIHDSPREADLSVHIYRRIFTLFADAEEAKENESVQYIIATTEAPPESLQQSPWLVCDPLSSADRSTRFLKTIV